MASASQVEKRRSDYGNYIFTDLEPKIFCRITSVTTQKTVFVAGRIRNVQIYQDEVSKVQ